MELGQILLKYPELKRRLSRQVFLREKIIWKSKLNISRRRNIYILVMLIKKLEIGLKMYSARET